MQLSYMCTFSMYSAHVSIYMYMYMYMYICIIYLVCTVPLQVTDADLMELIRTNVKLTIPYAGAFLKKDDRYAVQTCTYVHVWMQG